jgi:hypothetical protein
MVLCVLGAVPAAYAGSLEPSAPPAPTMKSLEQIPPTWDQKLPADDTGDPCDSARFKCVMGGAAVLDKETGLVWQKIIGSSLSNWAGAYVVCLQSTIGEREGWRLPTAEELSSLVDGTQQHPPLPLGHPFYFVTLDWYWTATTYPNDTTYGEVVSMDTGYVSTESKTSSHNYWCVRGGHGNDGGHY